MDNKKAILHWDSSEIEEDDNQMSWDDMIMELSNILDDLRGGGFWKATVENFGWRKMNGVKYFEAHNAGDFLRELLPNTECTFYVFKYKKGLKIRNYHHDSPTGDEVYTVLPIDENEFSDEK